MSFTIAFCHDPALSSFMTYNWICKINNTTRATRRRGTGYPSGAPDFTTCFSGVRVARSLVFCVILCRSLFVLLCLFTWPLYCLFVFDLRLLITPLMSSSFSQHQKVVYWGRLHQYLVVGLMLRVLSNVLTIHCIVHSISFVLVWLSILPYYPKRQLCLYKVNQRLLWNSRNGNDKGLLIHFSHATTFIELLTIFKN